MRTSTSMIAIVSVLGCQDAGAHRPSIASVDTREAALNGFLAILSLRVESGPVRYSRVEGHGSAESRASYWTWRAVVIEHLTRVNTYYPGAITSSVIIPIPARDVMLDGGLAPLLSGEFLQARIDQLNVSSLDGNALSAGRSYIVVVYNYPVNSYWFGDASHVLTPFRVFRVDAMNRLEEAALGFPAGAPVSQVMDRSTLRLPAGWDHDPQSPAADGGG